MTSLTSTTGRSQTLTALFLAVAMAVVVGTALGFQHIGGYMPCKLCLEQRTPYYVGVPLMALAALSSAMHWPSWLTRALLALGGLLMLYGLYLGGYHAGVEWRWWAGPTDCQAVSGTVDTGGKGLLDVLNTVVPPRCEDAALRVLGLSFAGWNVLASAFLAVVALRAAFKKA
ncbi:MULTISPECIES: disulfide bond formation protein B [Hyphomicrobiales]|jgi:disulfide bond formation protein DsbB|uniref:disulfide bond formation protein B n=1 Tax=Hyphomicrobiales TaxID=356 RepID=UPI0003815092|nr:MULTISPECIES: disulfide bond formation protein B [Phyllobacteriaceae]MCX8567821.1 disulfide bond formation protein B [Aminobacter sp. MET-1]